jgi:hypothetical protein
MPRHRAFSCLSAALLISGAIIEACDSDDATGTSSAPETEGGTGDGGAGGPGKDGEPATDAPATPDVAAEGGSCRGPIVTGNGETCIGHGKGSSCDPACGQPYGYLCVDGPPPGFSGCRETQTSALGNSYCCPKNECVAEPDQNGVCADADAGKTKRFQCPPDESGGHVAPPSGCVEHNSGPTELEKFYCCP